MSRAVFAVSVLVLTGCDLLAASEDYQRRYCADVCPRDAAACFEHCSGSGSGDGGAGGAGGADSGLEPGDWTFHVVRLQNVPANRSAPVQVFLEERSALTGVAVASDDLRARGVTWPSTSLNEAQLTRSEDGKGLALIGYQEDSTRLDDGGVSTVVSDATARRVGFVTREAADWSTTVTDAWRGGNVYSAATVNGASFFLTGASSGGSGGVRTAMRGSTGATVAINGSANGLVILVRAGRLYTSGSGSLFDWGAAENPVGTPTRLEGLTLNQPIGFELLDRRPEEPGLDTLYVAQSNGPAGVAKFVRVDGGWVSSWAASASTTVGEAATCSSLATRGDDAGSVAILCVRGPTGDAVVRFDDVSALDGGAPSPRIVFRAAPTDALRGVAILSE